MPNGNGVANISVATTDSWKDKNTGQLQERTEWHRVILFGKLAEVAGEYLRKGSKVYIEGRLQTRKWTGQSGQEKFTTEIVVDMGGQMQMLGGRSNDQHQGTGYQGGGYQGGHQQAGYQGGQQQRSPHQGGQQNNQRQSNARNNNAQGGYAPKPQQSQQYGGPQNPMEPPIDFDDDIPF